MNPGLIELLPEDNSHPLEFLNRRKGSNSEERKNPSDSAHTTSVEISDMDFETGHESD